MELINIAISMPVLPATTLLGIMLLWAMMVLLGAVDLHHAWHLPDVDIGLPHAEIDIPVDVPVSVPVHVPGGSIDVYTDPIGGAASVEAHGSQLDHLPDGSIASGKAAMSVLALRWLNLGGVPLIVWSCVFTLCWWTTSALLWTLVDEWLVGQSNSTITILLILRNLILAVLLTKVLTMPIRRALQLSESSDVPQSLIGKECLIGSTEATPDFGFVKFPTKGAPLLLNVRTDGACLPKGTPVWITHFDSKRKVYIVSPTSTHKTD